MGSMINANKIILKKMRYWTRIDAKGQLMSEYEDVQGQSQETKLVFDFKKMHDVMIELKKRGVVVDNR